VAYLCLWLATVEGRWKAVILRPSDNSLGDARWDLTQAVQQHIAVAEQDPMVVVIAVMHLPENLAAPSSKVRPL